MEKIATENLFLLEFLVDGVELNKKCECDAPPGETCVSFQFLDNAPLDVCEADFNPKRTMRGADKETVKSGKSCLFSLSPEQASMANEQLDIFISVMKKMQPGWLPEKVEIGTSVIGIANLFSELITSVELSTDNSPTAKTLKDIFDINDSQGGIIGKISVYIRMSCFGKLIVTQFQMNLEDKSVLFKDKEGKNLYRYKKAGKRKNSTDEKTTNQEKTWSKGYNAGCPQTPCGQLPGQTQDVRVPQEQVPSPTGYDCPFAPCDVDQPTNTPISGGYAGTTPGDYGVPRGFPGSHGTQTMLIPCNECGYITNPACLPPMSDTMMMGGPNNMYPMGPPPPPEGNYQEIGATMGGNSLTIRVHKDKGRAEQIDPNAVDDCTCGGGGGSGTAGPIVPMGNVGKTQQAFAMRPGASPNSPFSFRMGQCGDTGGMGPGGNNVVVNPPVYTAPDGTQFTEFSDPNKETFILRIGKKSEGVDRKNNLELELQTPKGPPLKPIPKKETVETQYDPLDAGSEDSGSKKGKGGKGKDKGKGGKKGKKK